MFALQFFSLVLLLICPALVCGQAQSSAAASVSSDDISVADGLQLPGFGHVWVLDTWKGVKELVQLLPPDSTVDWHGLPIKARHTIELKGEAASIRIHDTAPQIFMRGVTGNDSNETRAAYVIVRLSTEGEHRLAAKSAYGEIRAEGKGKSIPSEDVMELTQKRIGATDWYRLSLKRSLAPGEYVLFPLPGTPGAVLDERYDFAIDPQAPENRKAFRSEQDRQSQ